MGEFSELYLFIPFKFQTIIKDERLPKQQNQNVWAGKFSHVTSL